MDNLALLELRGKRFLFKVESNSRRLGEDIREKIVKSLPNFFYLDEVDTKINNDEVYKYNTQFTKLRNVPRDVPLLGRRLDVNFFSRILILH